MECLGLGFQTLIEWVDCLVGVSELGDCRGACGYVLWK